MSPFLNWKSPSRATYAQDETSFVAANRPRGVVALRRSVGRAVFSISGENMLARPNPKSVIARSLRGRFLARLSTCSF